jgi:ribosomal protein S18 acetylase RimI-like enzyme
LKNSIQKKKERKKKDSRKMGSKSSKQVATEKSETKKETIDENNMKEDKKNVRDKRPDNYIEEKYNGIVLMEHQDQSEISSIMDLIFKEVGYLPIYDYTDETHAVGRFANLSEGERSKSYVYLIDGKVAAVMINIRYYELPRELIMLRRLNQLIKAAEAKGEENKEENEENDEDSEVDTVALLGVHPDYQRRGLASQLINKCKLDKIRDYYEEKDPNLASSYMLKPIHLHCRTSNLPAQKLYEQQGFKFLCFLPSFYGQEYQNLYSQEEEKKRTRDANYMQFKFDKELIEKNRPPASLPTLALPPLSASIIAPPTLPAPECEKKKSRFF